MTNDVGAVVRRPDGLHFRKPGNQEFEKCVRSSFHEGLCLSLDEYLDMGKSPSKYRSDMFSAPWVEEQLADTCYVTFPHNCKMKEQK